MLTQPSTIAGTDRYEASEAVLCGAVNWLTPLCHFVTKQNLLTSESISSVHIHLRLIIDDVSCKERKCGGTSASRDENGQVDVWR